MAAHSSTLAWKIPWTEEPGRLQSMGSLRVGHDISDFTVTFSLSCTGEGNGNPLEGSCLENPRDGGAWWATVYRVAQSRTRLKRLSSSNLREASCLLVGRALRVQDSQCPLWQCSISGNSFLGMCFYRCCGRAGSLENCTLALQCFWLEETHRHNHQPRAGNSCPLMRLKLEVLVGTRAIYQICFVFSERGIAVVSFRASHVALVVTNQPAKAGGIRDAGSGGPLEEGVATHSSILAWRISWTEEPGGLQSMGSQGVRHN